MKADALLPPGWVEIKRTFDMTRGKVKKIHYYFHEPSGRSQNERPEAVVDDMSVYSGDDMYCMDITGRVNENELKRVVDRCHSYGNLVKEIHERIVYRKLSYDECMAVAKRIHVGETALVLRWKVDELRDALNRSYAARLQRDGHERFMKCLLEGGGPGGEGEVALLQAMGMAL